MLIVRNGIYREIDENKLDEYVAKGYIPVENPESKVDEATKVENPFTKMKTAELEAAAAELEIDLSECKNNVQRAAKLFELTTTVGAGKSESSTVE